MIGPIVAASILIAMLLGCQLGRRVQRRVLEPLGELRGAALAMREAGTAQTLELPHASAELRELATTLNETSIALRASHVRLQDEANTDALTGLPNRRAFVDELHKLLDNDGHGGIGVLFVDVDDFKVVNDSLGHAAGDELLRVIGRRLRSCTRQGELVARLGGDEFAIAVSGASTPAALVQIAERTLSVVQRPVNIAGTTVTVHCSIGVARSDSSDTSRAADELLRNADFAMYMAKSQGKGCFDVFAPSMHDEMLARMEIKRDLAQALALDQFRLHFQPVLDLASRATLGFEALIRWQHPTRGLLSPAEFLDLAEDTGDIVAIGEWVIHTACGTLAAMHAAHPTGPRPWISVNASSRQLAGHQLVHVIDVALENSGLHPADLVVEVTEGAAITNTVEARKTLVALRERGVHVALDDFGTGYSSLRWLSELPVDVLKIDRSFVAKAGDDSDSMLEAIVTLGRRLGMHIIAEGIEMPWELDRVRLLGADAGQGYLFARPMPAAEAMSFNLVPKA